VQTDADGFGQGFEGALSEHARILVGERCKVAGKE
jgi:hypothetical protein